MVMLQGRTCESKSKSGADSSDVRIVTLMSEDGTADLKVKPGSDSVSVDLLSEGEPEIYVDGVKTSSEAFEELTPGDVESISVFKEGGAGRIEVTTRKAE